MSISLSRPGTQEDLCSISTKPNGIDGTKACRLGYTPKKFSSAFTLKLTGFLNNPPRKILIRTPHRFNITNNPMVARPAHRPIAHGYRLTQGKLFPSLSQRRCLSLIQSSRTSTYQTISPVAFKAQAIDDERCVGMICDSINQISPSFERQTSQDLHLHQENLNIFDISIYQKYHPDKYNPPPKRHNNQPAILNREH